MPYIDIEQLLAGIYYRRAHLTGSTFILQNPEGVAKDVDILVYTDKLPQSMADFYAADWEEAQDDGYPPGFISLRKGEYNTRTDG